jgi:hypothetical protein
VVILETPIKTSWFKLSLSFSIQFYRLDGPELEPGRGDSPNMCKLVLGPIKPPLAWVPGLLLRSKVASAWQTTQIHLVLKFRLSGATPQTPPFCASIAGNAQLFLFHLYSTEFLSPLSPPLTWWEWLKDKTCPKTGGSSFSKTMIPTYKSHSFTTQERVISVTTSKLRYWTCLICWFNIILPIWAFTEGSNDL